MKTTKFTIHRANQLVDIKKARDSSVMGIEIDLRITRDRVVVLHHDRRFKDGLGRNLWIDRVSIDEIDRMSNDTIVRFEQILPEIISIAKDKKSFILDLDIKQFSSCKQIYAILKKFHAFSFISEIVISSPDVWVLQMFDDLDSRFRFALTLGPNDKYDLYDLKFFRYLSIVVQFTLKPFVFRLIRRKTSNKEIQYANIYHRLVKPEIVSFLHGQDIQVMAYGVRDESQKQKLLTMNVDGIKIYMVEE